jgi:hypothetical protein
VIEPEHDELHRPDCHSNASVLERLAGDELYGSKRPGQITRNG